MASGGAARQWHRRPADPGGAGGQTATKAATSEARSALAGRPGGTSPGRLQGWTRREGLPGAAGRRRARSGRRRGDGPWARCEQVGAGGSEPLPPYLGDAQRGKEGPMRRGPRHPRPASCADGDGESVTEDRSAAGKVERTRGAGRGLRPRSAEAEMRVRCEGSTEGCPARRLGGLAGSESNHRSIPRKHRRAGPDVGAWSVASRPPRWRSSSSSWPSPTWRGATTSTSPGTSRRARTRRGSTPSSAPLRRRAVEVGEGPAPGGRPASHAYIRYRRFFVLLATHGESPFFDEEARVGPRRAADAHPVLRVRHQPPGRARPRADRPAGLPGAEGLPARHRRPQGRIRPGGRGPGGARLRAVRPGPLPVPGDPRAVNRARAAAGLPGVPPTCLRTRRRVVRPFGPPGGGDPD